MKHNYNYEVSQKLRTFATFAEDSVSILNTHMGQLTTTYNAPSQVSLLDSMGLLAQVCIPTQRHIYT